MSKDSKIELIFSVASVVAELLAILRLFTKYKLQNISGPMLPTGDRIWQLISPHYDHNHVYNCGITYNHHLRSYV